MLVPLLAFVSLFVPALAGATSQRAAEIEKVQHYRQVTWHWQKIIGVAKTPTTYAERTMVDRDYRHWLLGLWRSRAVRVLKTAANIPHERQWRCIHTREGSWTANTGNGYYGGLQMDLTFQRTYGSYLLRAKGTADRWTPYEQMWVAERAYRSGRGFYPWPNTARACGYI